MMMRERCRGRRGSRVLGLVRRLRRKGNIAGGHVSRYERGLEE
jgi:hypothetical protein